jgi:branched-chain amino acid transport system permease protein
MKRALLFIAVISAVALAIGLMLDPRGYMVRVLCLVLIAASLGQAWNIVGGLANQISLGHAAYFGIGAYTTTILQIEFQLSPWIGLPIGMLLAVLAAALLSLPTMRLKGPYFALASLAFAEVCRIIAHSASGVTGGAQGISVPFAGDSLALMQFRSGGSYVPIVVGLFFVVYVVYALMANGRLGYMLRAVREDEEAAEVSGVNTFGVKILGSIVSAALTAAVGTIFAQFTYFIDPDTVFSVAEVSIRAALIAIIGGVGTLAGPIIGALLVVSLEEFLNAYLSAYAAGLAPFLFGAVLVFVVIVRPRGLASLLPGRKPK